MPNPTPLRYAALCERFPILPRTAVIEDAFDYARGHMPDFLLNHVARSWIFATRVAQKNAIAYDAEVVAVATLIHDIGFTPTGEGPHRFEVNGAFIAADFGRQRGFDPRRAQLVWDSVALHATPSINVFKEPEVAVCGRGIGVDFGTPDYASFSAQEMDEILTAVPRLDMVKRFTACACQMAQRQPETTYDNFVRDFGERFVPGYKAPNWVDIIGSGPYTE